jgi:N-acetylglucosamine-6-phosphate deacetylase
MKDEHAGEISPPEKAAYFDLQVNGYAGIDFNQDDLSAEDLRHACRRLEEDGVAGILATVITDTLDLMCARLSRIAAIREEDPLVRRIVAGVHIEGPFINETSGYRGAHPLDAVLPASVDDLMRLLDAAEGLARLVTLAPERDTGFRLTRRLVAEGVAVAAGHCDPSLDELRGAIDEGLSLFTHLGNACPMQMHRHDNVIQRALSLHRTLKFTFIADGAHIPFFALGNYLRAAGIDRCVVVTDAIAPAGLGPGRYTVGRWDLQIGEDMVARAPDGSHLVGAAVTMRQSFANLVEQVGVTDEEARRLTVENPRSAIRPSLRG